MCEATRQHRADGDLDHRPETRLPVGAASHLDHEAREGGLVREVRAVATRVGEQRLQPRPAPGSCGKDRAGARTIRHAGGGRVHHPRPRASTTVTFVSWQSCPGPSALRQAAGDPAACRRGNTVVLAPHPSGQCPLGKAVGCRQYMRANTGLAGGSDISLVKYQIN